MNSRKPHEDDDREAYSEDAPREEKGDKYVSTAEVVFISKTIRAVFVEWWDDKTKRKFKEWVPRSCLHHNTDKKVEASQYGDKLILTCFEWVAKEKGLPI